MTRSRIFRWVKIIILIYVIAGIALYFLQEKFLFHPEPLDIEHKFTFSQPFTEVNVPVSEEKNISVIQFKSQDSVRRGIVLYYHGNRRNVERYAKFASAFTSKGFDVWMPDYPGFGKSTGKRDEKIMCADAELVYKMAVAQMPGNSIIIYGKSMGTGPATYVASRQQCSRLILETPYYSIDELFRHYAFMYPVTWMSKYHFPSNVYIERVDAPVTIFHGTNDGVIPFSHARRLAAIGKGTELVTIKDGKHNDLAGFDVYKHKLDSLLR